MLLSDKDPFLENGVFSPDHLLNSAKAFVQMAIDEGWNGARMTADMGWLANKVDNGDLIFRNMRISPDGYLSDPEVPVVAICQYVSIICQAQRWWSNNIFTPLYS